MKSASLLRRVLPPEVSNIIRNQRERMSLRGLDQSALDTSHLAEVDTNAVAAALHDDAAAAAWKDFSRCLNSLDVVSHAGGVNPGDRRALFHLVHHFRPVRVLEIGTHIGASTVCIAGALNAIADDSDQPRRSVTTVDVIDVNDTHVKPWAAAGASLSPQALLASMNVADRAQFVCSSSLDFLSDSDESFDFIFLDGDHHAKTIFREIPLAVARLEQGGLILLHDYYPDGRPLWRDRKVLPGPYLAVDRWAREGTGIKALPLGELPWPTKLDSNVTSLAVLVR